MARTRLSEEEKRLFEAFLMPKTAAANAARSSFDVAESTSPVVQRGDMAEPSFQLTMDDISRPSMTDTMLASLPAPSPDAPPQRTLPVVPKAEPAMTGKPKRMPDDNEIIKSFLSAAENPPQESDFNPMSVIGQAVAGFGDAVAARGGSTPNALNRTIGVQDKMAAADKEKAAAREMNDPNSAKSKAYQALLKEMFPDMNVGQLSAAQAEKVMGPLGQIVEKREARKAAAEAKREKLAEGQKPPAGYRWTPEGNLEAIPGGPAKESPGEKQANAKERVTQNLKTIGGLYKKLDKLGGIVDTEDKALANVPRRIASSGVGQMAGKLFGTKEQSVRNQINQLRPLLIQDIRQATEMGARGLDSEKELEFYLQSATDPTADIQTNLRALEVLDRAYGLGMGINAEGGSDDELPVADSVRSGAAAELARRRGQRG